MCCIGRCDDVIKPHSLILDLFMIRYLFYLKKINICTLIQPIQVYTDYKTRPGILRKKYRPITHKLRYSFCLIYALEYRGRF